MRSLLRLPVVLPVVGVMAAGLVAVAVPPASAAGVVCTLSRTAGLNGNDIDADGRSDTVVGLPNGSGSSSASGVLDVHGSRSGNHAVAGSSIAGFGASKSFGAAALELNFNGDYCTDVAVGDPGRSGGGAVDLLLGSNAGVTTAGAVQIKARTANDDYGAAIAISNEQYGLSGHTADLWIGAPGRTVHGLADAGAIDHYQLSVSGAVTFVESITQASPVVHDHPQAGNRFGSVLAGDGNSLVAGTPRESVAGQAGAGAVTMLTAGGSTTPAVTSGQTFTQDSPGVPGASEAGDRFGASVAIFGYVAVGVPGEDIGSTVDAGMVQLFDTSLNGAWEPITAISQDSPGVPGLSEAGDQFGAALAMGYTGDSIALLWIGVPGEGLGNQPNAGDVIQDNFDYEDSPGFATYTTLRQGQGSDLGGAYEANDHVGQTLTSIPLDFQDGNDQYGVEIGDPGEDLGSVVDAGVVIDVPPPGGFGALAYVENSAGPKTGQEYGAVLAGSDPDA